jgi:hypothetical protein
MTMKKILDKFLKSLSKEDIEMLKLKTRTKFANGEITKEKHDKMMYILNKNQKTKNQKKKNKKTRRV